MPIPLANIPKDIDAEEAVNGSLLIDGAAITRIVSYLRPTDFYSERGMFVYNACVSLYQRDEPINQITVGNQLHQDGKLSTAGGAAYLSHLVSNCATSLDIDSYAKIVHQASVYRKIITFSEMITDIGVKQDPDVNGSFDKIATEFEKLRQDTTMATRKLVIERPRLVETQPPYYIWNVNGTDIRFSLIEITTQTQFKRKVVAECNFVPLQPKNWDAYVNELLQISVKIEAPMEASSEYQLKLTIGQIFDKYFTEATEFSDLARGYVRRKFSAKPDEPEIEYYCLKSTALVTYLEGKKITISPNDLWAKYISKWGGVRHKGIRIGDKTTSLWCIPVSAFDEEAEQREPAQIPEVPEDF